MRKNNTVDAKIMHFNENYARIMQVMQKLCTNYAKIMQKLCKNYAKIMQKKLRKNYAYVCKLHNLHYYAPPTLLMVTVLRRAAQNSMR